MFSHTSIGSLDIDVEVLLVKHVVEVVDDASFQKLPF